MRYNVPKNRSQFRLPYNETRVLLKRTGGGPGSDYINASFVSLRGDTCKYVLIRFPQHLVAAHLLFYYWEDFVLLQIFDASTQTLFLLTELKHVVVAYPFVSETTHHLLLLKKNLFVIANLCCIDIIRPFFPSRFFWTNNHVMLQVEYESSAGILTAS